MDSFAPDIVDEVEPSAEDAFAGASDATQDDGESSDEESSDGDGSKSENSSPVSPVGLSAGPATLSKQVQYVKPKNNRNAGTMAKKAGITKP